MTLTAKEKSLLTDLQSQEQLCIEKYALYSSEACDGELKNLFSTLNQNEQMHLNTINDILSGKEPNMSGNGNSSGNQGCNCNSNQCGNYNNDAFLCKDALSMEKHASSLYDISIFEFNDENLRNVLNQIQKQEQNHGKQLYQYLTNHNMY